MRTVALPLLFLVLVCSASAQTATYTTTQDACGGKANQACYNIPVVDQHAVAGHISIDNRYPSTDPLQYNFYLGQYGTNGYHGTYSGFVANSDKNPNGTPSTADFNGIASFESDDETVSAQFQYHAYYVKVCSGRGCGGTLGWHYRILAGGTVTVN